MTTRKVAEKRKSDKRQRNILIYKAIEYMALSNNLKPRSKEAIKKVHISLGLVAPEVPRTEDLEDKASFIIEENRLIVSLYTGFNLEKRDFNKNGALQIVISAPTDGYDSKRVFVRQFKRVPGVDLIVEDYLEYILEEISEERRPLTKRGNWASLLEITQDHFFWVDENEKPIRNFFENTLPGSRVEISQKQREHYELVVRGRRKYKKRRREIKKPYKKRRK